MLNALAQQHLKDRAAIVRRPTDQEVARSRTPGFFEPINIGLEAACRRDKGRRPHIGAAIAKLH